MKYDFFFFIFERLDRMQHVKRLFFLYISRIFGIKTIQKKLKEVLPNISLNPKFKRKKKSKQSLKANLIFFLPNWVELARLA
jgi:hypothetical protein